MSKEFNLEDEILRIANPITKSYMDEVISSYNSENYRSAIVTLYSTLIYDLRAKLVRLSNNYNDVKAIKLVKDLQSMDEKAEVNPKNMPYSKIENHLLDKIKETPFWSAVEYRKIENLKFLRNMSAHPVIKNDYMLFVPHRDEVRAAIRDCIVNVFQRELLLSTDLAVEIMKKANELYSEFEPDNLKQFLNGRFYSRMTTQAKEKAFFSLWKMCFILHNEDCNKTRESTYHALIYLVESDTEYFRRLAESNDYSRISFPDISDMITPYGFEYYNAPDKNSGWSYLVFFLSIYPFFYAMLPDHIKTAIKDFCSKNVRYLTLSYFIDKTIDKHLMRIKDKLNSIPHPITGFKSSALEPIHKDLVILFNNAKEKFCEELVKQFIINRAIKPDSYYISEHYYDFIMIREKNIFTDDELDYYASNAQNSGQTSPEVSRKLEAYLKKVT